MKGKVAEFGKTPIGELIKALRIASSKGLYVEVANPRLLTSDLMSARRYLIDIKAILTFKKCGQRVFSLEDFVGVKVKFLDLGRSLDLEAKRLCLIEMGNQWYFQSFLGVPKVQDC